MTKPTDDERRILENLVPVMMRNGRLERIETISAVECALLARVLREYLEENAKEDGNGQG